MIRRQTMNRNRSLRPSAAIACDASRNRIEPEEEDDYRDVKNS
jgi:hypothetical protein